METVLYMHGGSGNHGCEAIIRTTSELLGGPEHMTLWSLDKRQDQAAGAAEKFEKIVVSEEIKRLSPQHFEAALRRKLLRQSDGNMKVFLRSLFRGTVAISVGGDNYCYPWSAEQNASLNREIRKYARATVLWGCSIDEEAITPEIREDLAQYDLITAREPLTYRLLKAINANTVQVADPAFLLGSEELPLPEEFAAGNTVGINVSPLVMRYSDDGSIVTENYETLIRYILAQTDMHICLIPHVVWDGNNDLEPLTALYEKFRDTGRVCLLGDHNAMELKGYIGRCRFFVGARTHATIGAYSTCVPTLVVGYSVKSRGIAEDLFGASEHYVLPVQSMTRAEMLKDEFCWLMKHEQRVRASLQEIMPAYQARAASAKLHFRQMLERK